MIPPAVAVAHTRRGFRPAPSVAAGLLLALSACAIRSEVPTREAAQLVLGSVDQGCSHVPDVAHGFPCLDHDSAYWVGGTERDRFIADSEFLASMALWGVPEPIAVVYYLGVRLFGWCCFEYSAAPTRGPPPP